MKFWDWSGKGSGSLCQDRENENAVRAGQAMAIMALVRVSESIQIIMERSQVDYAAGNVRRNVEEIASSSPLFEAKPADGGNRTNLAWR